MLENVENAIEPYDAKVAERLDFIIDAIGMCLSKPTIIKKFSEEYGLSNQTAYRYYKSAMWQIQQEVKKSRSEHVANSINSSKFIYKRAVAAKDHAAAISALKYRDAVIGLHEPLNEGAPPNGSNAGAVEINDRSLEALGNLIADSKAEVGEVKPVVVEPEQP